MQIIVSLRRQFVNFWLGWVAAFAMLQSVPGIVGLYSSHPLDSFAITSDIIFEVVIFAFSLFFFLPIALQRFRRANQFVRLRRSAASKDEQMTQSVALESVADANQLPISTKVEVKMKNIISIYAGILIFIEVLELCSVSFVFLFGSSGLPLEENILISAAVLLGCLILFAILLSPVILMSIRSSRYIVQATEVGIEVARRNDHWEIPWQDVRLILQIPSTSLKELLAGGFFRPVGSGSFDAIFITNKQPNMLDDCYEIASATQRILIFIPPGGTFTKREGLFGQPIFDDPATYRERMQAIIALAVERTGVQIRAAREPDAPARP